MDPSRPSGADPRGAGRDPLTPWRGPHPKEPPRPGTVPLPSEQADANWYGFSRVAPHVYVGRQLGSDHDDDEHLARDAAFLKRQGVRAVLDMRQEGRDEGPTLAREGLAYRRVRVEDHYAPTMAQLDEAVQFIRTYVGQGMDIYVHCHVGHARSATAVMAYLISQGRSLGEALAQVEAARTISVRWNHADLDSLRQYAAHVGRPELGTSDDRLPPHQAAEPGSGQAPSSPAQPRE